MSVDHQCHAQRPHCEDCASTDFECSACGHDLDIDNLIGDDPALVAEARMKRWRQSAMDARADATHYEDKYDDVCARLEVVTERLGDVLASTRGQVAELIGCAEQIHGEDYTVWHGADAALVAIAHALGLAPHVDTEARVTFVEGGPAVVQMVPSSW